MEQHRIRFPHLRGPGSLIGSRQCTAGRTRGAAIVGHLRRRRASSAEGRQTETAARATGVAACGNRNRRSLEMGMANRSGRCAASGARGRHSLGRAPGPGCPRCQRGPRRVYGERSARLRKFNYYQACGQPAVRVRPQSRVARARRPGCRAGAGDSAHGRRRPSNAGSVFRNTAERQTGRSIALFIEDKVNSIYVT
jgi:hypothetical protein